MLKTKLFEVVSKVRFTLCACSPAHADPSQMPKGALLHAHLDAMVDARVLLRSALKYPAMHVRTAEKLTPENLRATLPEFRPLPENEWTSFESLVDDAYAPGTWVPLTSARETFGFGGPSAFDDWVVAALTINPSESYVTHNTTDKVRTLRLVRIIHSH